MSQVGPLLFLLPYLLQVICQFIGYGFLILGCMPYIFYIFRVQSFIFLFFEISFWAPKLFIMMNKLLLTLNGFFFIGGH